MIEISVSGDLFKDALDALVNPVNTVGTMGAGLALRFKRTWPENFTGYARACARGEIRVGSVWSYETGVRAPRFIFNVPTKEHWRERSRLEWVEAGAESLARAATGFGVASVGVPALGCGLGGLEWSEVRPRLEAVFATSPQIRWVLYAPR
jgi:O-acetyl-ADP-ribose deacetylase (regulator of RNase III)